LCVIEQLSEIMAAKAAANESFRRVEGLVRGIATADGDGVPLTRVLTPHLQRRLDPFLMLDAFRNDDPEHYSGGFSDHPHRGFQTVTHMLAGRMRHRDNADNEGLLGPDGAQWMTAGSGPIHSEMPEQAEGLVEGFQLWLNLPAKNKMIAPSYRDIPPAAIPEFSDEGGIRVRVLAGTSHGVAGAVQRPDTEPLYLDVHLPAGARLVQEIPAGRNALTHTYRGGVKVSGTMVPDQHMAVLANDGAGANLLESDAPARLPVIAGKPLNEPIAQDGPFVMNTANEIQQTLRDFRDGKFEAASVEAL
jgi:quercetin 2,3-dioxygenase